MFRDFSTYGFAEVGPLSQQWERYMQFSKAELSCWRACGAWFPRIGIVVEFGDLCLMRHVLRDQLWSFACFCCDTKRFRNPILVHWGVLMRSVMCLYSDVLGGIGLLRLIKCEFWMRLASMIFGYIRGLILANVGESRMLRNCRPLLPIISTYTSGMVDLSIKTKSGAWIILACIIL